MCLKIELIIGCDSAKELASVCNYSERFQPSKVTVRNVDASYLMLSNNLMEIAKES
jgi:hypothetical protein